MQRKRLQQSLIQEAVAKGKRKSSGMKQTAETQQTWRGLGRYFAASWCSKCVIKKVGMLETGRRSDEVSVAEL